VALIACGFLAAAPTASVATPPGKNGQIAFRRYLDAKRSTGALFRANSDGSGVVQVTHPPRGVVDQFEDWSPDGRRLVFERKVPCPPAGPETAWTTRATASTRWRATGPV
jgi:Tol biopolymer transport system component